MTHTRLPLHEQRRITRAAGTVSLFTFLSRILGLVRDMVIATFFGSGMAADAFFVAFRIPNLLRRLFAEGSLTMAFVPVFTEYLNQKRRPEAFHMARVVLTLLSLTLAFVALLGTLLSPWIVRVQAFGFGGEGPKYALTVLLTRITFPYVLLVGLVAFFMGVLNSLGRFAAPAAAPILLNVGIVGGATLISPFLSEPILGVGAGVLIGGILQVCLQVPWVMREGLSFRPDWNPSHPAVKRIMFLMIPAILGSAVYQFNQFIGTLLASFLAEGSVSWLYYADRLVQFPLGVFAIAVSTAALPSMARQAAEGKMRDLSETVHHALRLVLFITLPAMAGLLVLGEAIVTILFERGAFGAADTRMTYQALLFYTLGLWAFSGIRVLVAAFYALQDTRTPVGVALVSLAANLVLSVLLMRPMKHTGLALALSLASGLQVCLLIYFLGKSLPLFRVGPLLRMAGRCASAATLMGGCIYWMQVLLCLPAPEKAVISAFKLAGLSLCGATVYFLAAWALRLNEASSLGQGLRTFFNKFGRKGRVEG